MADKTMTCEIAKCRHPGLWVIDEKKWLCRFHRKKLLKKTIGDIYSS